MIAKYKFKISKWQKMKKYDHRKEYVQILYHIVSHFVNIVLQCETIV
jgi:hypothetical protein